MTPTATAHGWVIDGNDPELRPIPCPTCSPPILATREAVRLQGQGIWRIPAYARNWTFHSFGKLDGSDADTDVAVRTFVMLLARGQGDVTHPKLDEITRGLYLYGDFGRGKTGLAVCALKTLIQMGYSGAFIQTARLVSLVKRGFDRPDVAEQLDLAETADALVLDDLGSERPTSWVLEFLVTLLELRRSAGQITILTSNFSPSDLGDAWSESAKTTSDEMNVSRLMQRIPRYCRVLEVAGPNLALGASHDDE